MARPKKNPDAPKAPAKPKVYLVCIGASYKVFVRAASKSDAMKHAMRANGGIEAAEIKDEVVMALGIEDKVQDITKLENPSN